MWKYEFDTTPIQLIEEESNKVYIKRDDLIPFSFGGNKVRIANEYMRHLKEKKCNCMVAYGNSRSNLCRVIANMCVQEKIECYVISPIEDDEQYIETNNSMIVENIVKEIIPCRKSEVPTVIETTLNRIRKNGKKPYFIYDEENEKCTMNAYIEAFKEIKEYEEKEKIYFDYIFLASGTATTQSGLICGKILNEDEEKKIIGISIARKKKKGESVIRKNVEEYLLNKKLSCNINKSEIQFIDDYILNGYGKYNEEIKEVIREQLYKNGIPLDPTYTGKAFWGMQEYIKKNRIVDKNILFIHTGGAPLFFDNIKLILKEEKK